MIFHPVEFRQRGSFAADCYAPAPMPVESAPTSRTRCPSCNLPAIAPVASTYLGGGQVENEWTCSGCGFAWRSGFDGLSV